ncbi:hypothetical protein [Paenibacillus lupini]|uniref:hypothetical protein n=1 Tax=Paenibacillus lupini TaxID=1450204 RepID=UPI0014233F3A|nr:hypothetical protein [Paenibacillus lupini]NIK22715.1 tetratricopeptide (TPR) repeat protein [Paenibacillus lupini]
MNKKRAHYVLASMVMTIIAFITMSGTSMAQGSSDELVKEYSNKANQFFAAKDYEQAAMTLEELLAREPDLNNEMVYKQLTHIYDDYLFDFEKALFFIQRI